MQEKLRELRTTNDPFWIELNVVPNRHPRPAVADNVAEDIISNPEDDDNLDDSDVILLWFVNSALSSVQHDKPANLTPC